MLANMQYSINYSPHTVWKLQLNFVPAHPNCFIVGLLWSTRCKQNVSPDVNLISQLVLRFFPEEAIPYVAVDLVCLWEEASSESHVATLNQNAPIILGNRFPVSQTQLIPFPKTDLHNHAPVFTNSPFLTWPRMSQDMIPHL